MKPIHFLLGLVVALAWGTNFVAVKISIETLPPIFVAGLRQLAVSLILFPFIKKMQLSFKELYYIAFTSGITFASLIYVALSLENSNITPVIIIVQLHVPITAILGYFIVKEKMSVQGILGVLLAFLGAALVIWKPGNITSYLALFLSVVVAFSGALFNVKLRQVKEFDPLSLVGWCAIINAPQLLILSIIFEEVSSDFYKYITLREFAAFIHTIVVSSILGFVLWFSLLKRYPANLVAPFALLIPIFGAISCVYILNHILTTQVVVGGILTMIGVAIVNIYKKHA